MDGSGDELPPSIQREYSMQERRFESLARDVRLPSLDQMLFQRYFLQNRSQPRLELLKRVNEALETHRLQTIRVLKYIYEREQIMNRIRETAAEYSRGRLKELEVQTQALHLFSLHQEVTLRIVEAIVSWREALARPYAFQYRNKNFFTCVLEDCEWVDGCSFRDALPLHLARHPLCSNISSLSLFASGTPTKAPPSSSAAQSPPRASRLRVAEELILREGELQQRLMRELNAVAASNSFVMLLNLPDIVPNCASGVPITDANWVEKNREMLRAAQIAAEGRREEPPAPASEPATISEHPNASESSNNPPATLQHVDAGAAPADHRNEDSSRRDDTSSPPRPATARTDDSFEESPR